MSDEAALLHAVYANPDEDTPRLVYADWLDENGQPERAEFIRVQIELANLLDETSDRFEQLLTREKALWDAHWKEWIASFTPGEPD